MSVLVVDVGTSGLRAAVVRPDGEVSALHYRAFPPATPFPGLVEFDAVGMAAAVLSSGAGALGRALPSVGVSGYYHLFNAVPYALTLAILIWTCSPSRSLKGAPMELGVSQ